MMTGRFTEEQVQALRDLDSLWGRDGLVLIGASALGCSIDMNWRETHDLDISATISINDYPGGLRDLQGWRPHPTLEHEWFSPHGVRVDVLPGAQEHLDAEAIVWPESGFRMSLVGVHLAFAHSQRIRITNDLDVRVAPASVITVLKMVAYQDRPFERDKDLGDLGHLLERYIGHDDERRYSPDVLDSELDFEDVSAFLLGRDVGAVVGDVERRVVASFIAKLYQDGNRAATQARMLRQGPRAWNNDPLVLLSRLQAFDRGLGAPEELVD